ncbi:hypothetical protein FACS1894132_09970 [Clostridia bacterium]|nr:hypothetical protein FACS1894132_09970 [Clostridia bacterium]
MESLFIKTNVFGVEDKTIISFSSDVFKAMDVLDAFISATNIKKYLSEINGDSFVFDNIPEDITVEEFEPLTPLDEYISQEVNDFDLVFINCGDFVENEVYSKLSFAITKLNDVLSANYELRQLSNFVKKINSNFSDAKIKCLVEDVEDVFEENGVRTLADLCNRKNLNISLSSAKSFSNILRKTSKRLILPKVAVERLLSFLSEKEEIIIKHRLFYDEIETLEQLASRFGITRERVRQIVQKVSKNFGSRFEKTYVINDLFFTLKALCKSELAVTFDELEKYELPLNFTIFLSDAMEEKPLAEPIDGVKCIPFNVPDGKYKWIKNTEKFSKNLPAILSIDDLNAIASKFSAIIQKQGYNVTPEIVIAIAFKAYTKNGKTMTTKGIKLGDRYQFILEKVFPEGIHIYAKDDMAAFRAAYDSYFDDERIAEYDHAVISRLTECCVLIDKGIYIYDKKVDLPEKLENEIYDFIVNYPYDMVMTNTLMQKFSDEFAELGIYNKYYLHSVLKRYFADKFTFKRDYVLKKKDASNFYNNIFDFIKSHPDGVSFSAIKQNFEGVPETVLYFALSKNDLIVPLYNTKYIHKDHIIFNDTKQVYEYLKKVIEKEKIISDQMAFDLIKENFPSLVKDNNIDTSAYMFSVLRAFFKDDFKFPRPHILDLNFECNDAKDALRKSFSGNVYANIPEIRRFAKDKQIIIYDFLRNLDSYNDEYFILNKEHLIRIDKIGYSQKDFLKVEKIVETALGDKNFSLISDLDIKDQLPKSKVPITDWLIYSIINKYGKNIYATTSTLQFISSEPIVARNGVAKDTVRQATVNS